MEDREIVQLYLSRDEDAIACTKEKYGRRIRNVIFGITGDIESTEEGENDTYLKAWNAIPPNEPYDYLYPFLIRIAKNLALKTCRSRNTLKRKAEITELSLELSETLPDRKNEDFSSDLLIREVLNRFLRSLSADKRTVFLRRYWYQDSITEIAAGCGMTESRVKTILFRLRKQLRARLEKEDIVV